MCCFSCLDVFLLSQQLFLHGSEKICTPMELVEVTQLREGPEVFKIKPESLKDLQKMMQFGFEEPL